MDLTLVLLAQLPTSVISEGLSKDTFQFVSSVGRGSEYGTAMPLSRSERAASSGCWGAVGRRELRNEWSVRRKRSRGGIREFFGRTLGNRASIYKCKVNKA